MVNEFIYKTDMLLSIFLPTIFVISMIIMTITVLIKGKDLYSEIPKEISKEAFLSFIKKLLKEMKYEYEDGDEETEDSYCGVGSISEFLMYDKETKLSAALHAKYNRLMSKIKLRNEHTHAHLYKYNIFFRAYRKLKYKLLYIRYKLKKRNLNSISYRQRNAYAHRAFVTSIIHIFIALSFIFILSTYGFSLILEQQVLFSLIAFMVPFLLFHYYLDHLFWLKEKWKNLFIRIRFYTLISYFFSFLIGIYFFNPIMKRIEFCSFVISMVLYLVVPLITYLKYAVHGMKHNKVLYIALMSFALPVFSYLVYLLGNEMNKYLANTVNYSYMRIWTLL